MWWEKWDSERLGIHAQRVLNGEVQIVLLVLVEKVRDTQQEGVHFL